jgi:hypothetical protein
MTTKKKKVVLPPTPKQEITKSADFKSYFANWVSATFSVHEVSMVIGESFQTGPETVEVSQKARVIFSPVEGKLLMVILRKIVDAYEVQFGRINIPHQIGDPLLEQMPELKEFMDSKTEGD